MADAGQWSTGCWSPYDQHVFAHWERLEETALREFVRILIERICSHLSGALRLFAFIELQRVVHFKILSESDTSRFDTLHLSTEPQICG